MNGACCAAAAAAWPATSRAAPPGFAHWVAGFRASALKRGVSEATYARVMNAVEPDMSALEAVRAQPEFTEKLWQYINRRCSEWRVVTCQQRAREHAALLARIERDYGVERFLMLALWGMESSFGDVVVNRKYMRPVIPRWPRSPGASRAGGAIGRPSFATRSSSWSAAGRSLPP